MISSIPINPETEIMGSSFDRATRLYTYTLGRGGKRWTVTVTERELLDLGQGPKHKAARQRHICTKLHHAMHTQEADR